MYNMYIKYNIYQLFQNRVTSNTQQTTGNVTMQLGQFSSTTINNEAKVKENM